MVQPDDWKLRPPTLIEVEDERERNNKRRESCSHILYAIAVSDVDEALNTHKELVDSIIETETIGSEFTGILLCQNGALLHYIEAPAAICAKFLTDLGKCCEGESAILLSSEDCDRRYFQSWSHQMVQVPDEDLGSLSSENPTDLAFDVFSNVMLIATGSNAERNTPSRKKLEFFTQSDAFFSIQSYLGAFNDPFSLVLDSERVWPLQPDVQFEEV